MSVLHADNDVEEMEDNDAYILKHSMHTAETSPSL